MMEKKTVVSRAVARFLRLQFRGSRGDLLGIGRLSMRPSELMRKTLPERSAEQCLDFNDEVVEEDEIDAMFASVMLQATWAEGNIKNYEMKNNIRLYEMNGTHDIKKPSALAHHSEVVEATRGLIPPVSYPYMAGQYTGTRLYSMSKTSMQATAGNLKYMESKVQNHWNFQYKVKVWGRNSLRGRRAIGV